MDGQSGYNLHWLKRAIEEYALQVRAAVQIFWWRSNSMHAWGKSVWILWHLLWIWSIRGICEKISSTANWSISIRKWSQIVSSEITFFCIPIISCFRYGHLSLIAKRSGLYWPKMLFMRVYVIEMVLIQQLVAWEYKGQVYHLDAWTQDSWGVDRHDSTLRRITGSTPRPAPPSLAKRD